MRDFVLDDGFLQSCIDLPRQIRQEIVSRLHAFTGNPRDRTLGVARVDGDKHVLSIPVDDAYWILLRREKSVTTLLLAAKNHLPSTAVSSSRGVRPVGMVIAPVDALETLLLEGKYLLLAEHLVRVPAATRELQFRFLEIEKILNTHLPPEARKFHNWWANQKSGKRAHAFAWMAAGWLVSEVNINASLVSFIRR